MINLLLLSLVSAISTETSILSNQTNVLNINQFNTKFPWLRPKKPFYEVNVGLNFNNHTSE